MSLGVGIHPVQAPDNPSPFEESSEDQLSIWPALMSVG